MSFKVAFVSFAVIFAVICTFYSSTNILKDPFTKEYLKKRSLVSDDDSCRWYNEKNEIYLDLSPLQGYTVVAIGSDNSNNEYNTSICSNNLLCPGQTGTHWMVTQQYVPDPSLCYYLGSYDSTIQPAYSNDTNGEITWTFTYPNGEASGGCSVDGRTSILRFICDTNAQIPKATAYEVESCTYETDIQTMYACPSYNPSQCVFTDPYTQYNLNLTQYVDDVFGSQDANGNLYSYSPCLNNVSCPYAGDGIVKYEAIGECYITAKVDNTLNSVYSLDENGNDMFTLYYQNGIADNNLCKNGRSTVIYWHCNATSSDGEVYMSSYLLDNCEYQLDLYSNDACVDN